MSRFVEAISRAPRWVVLIGGGVFLAHVAFAVPAEDRRVEAALRATYNYRVILQDHVRIAALNGTLTLTGTLQDAEEQALAGATAAFLPGVTAVQNQVKIEPIYPANSDSLRASKIRSRLLMKARVSGHTTIVSVQQGVVTLTGLVSTEAQKAQSEVYARQIPGVTGVDNQLIVKLNASVGDRVIEMIDDPSIAAQVQTSWTSAGVGGVSTKLSVKQGVVVITGVAATPAERDLVTQLANDVRGVLSVDNRMTVIAQG